MCSPGAGPDYQGTTSAETEGKFRGLQVGGNIVHPAFMYFLAWDHSHDTTRDSRRQDLLAWRTRLRAYSHRNEAQAVSRDKRVTCTRRDGWPR